MTRKTYCGNLLWQSSLTLFCSDTVSLLQKPGDLELRLGSETLRIENVGAGLRDWLVVVPRSKDHCGNQPFWNGDSYTKTMPFDTDRRRVTNVKAIPACTPVATLVRDNAAVIEVVSRTGIADSLKFHCLNVVGSVSK